MLYGRTADHPADQEAIANRAYADRNGNGNVESGDGWRFHGRGLKQVTGRTNYRGFAEEHTRMFGEQIDFEAEPDLLGTPRYAVRSALWFGSVAQIGCCPDGPFPRTDLSCDLCDGCAERGEAVEQ